MKKKIAYVIGAIVAILIVIVIVLVLNNQKYVVTFDMQNGEPKFEQLVKRGNRVYEPSDPKKKDYIFLGWYEGNELYDFTKVVKYNMTLVARWEKDDYVKVSFETVGGNTIEPISVKKGEKVTRPIDPKKTGHTFKMWTLNGEAFDFETPITEDITLLATYEDVYSVYFDSNGGSKVASGTVKGGKIAKPEDPTRKGYKFLGWYLEDKAYDFNTEVKDNMTLKAKWLLENAYIKSRTAADNEKLIGLDFSGSKKLSSGEVNVPFAYPINKIIVGATKPTKNIAKAVDLSVNKDGSVKAYVVKSGTNYDLLIAAEDTRTIINLPSNSSYLFANIYADSITFNSNVNSKNVTNMSYMFVSSAWTINLKNLDTSNVTNMEGMFCKKLLYNAIDGLDYPYYTGKAKEKLLRFYYNNDYENGYGDGYVRIINDLNTLNVSKVTNMSYLFSSSAYTQINLSKWNTSKVTNMEGMFEATYAGSSNLNGLKTSNVTNMRYMFWGSNLISTAIENFDTSKVTDMAYMLASKYVGALNLSKWNTSKVTKMNSMFFNKYSDSKFTKLDLSGWDTSKVTNMESMFSGIKADYIMGLNNFNTSKVELMSGMFGNTDSQRYYGSPTKIGNFDISNWDTSNVVSMSYMFTGMDLKGKNLDLSKWDTSKVTYMDSMFSGIKVNSIIGLNNFDTSKVKYMIGMFGLNYNCGTNCFEPTEIENLDISSWDTSNVLDMEGMFSSGKFKKLILTNFKAVKLTNAMYMFADATIEELYINSLDLTNVEQNEYAFENLQNYDKLYIQTNESMKNFITKNYPEYAGCFNMQ